jgi:hypothetical protein
MRDGDRFGAADRAVTPVVGKSMEATLAVLYIGLVTTALYGGAVPDYRAEAGAEVAERTLADAATDIEAAVPPETTAATVSRDVELPATIAGSAYRIRTAGDGDRLVLDHPTPEIGGSVPLLLPERVVAVSGTWESGEDARLVVTATDGGLEVRLE